MSPMSVRPAAPSWWLRLRMQLRPETRRQILAELAEHGVDVKGWPK